MVTTNTDNAFIFKMHSDEACDSGVKEEIPSVFDDGRYRNWWLFSICRLGLLRHTGVSNKPECKYKYDLDGSKVKVTGIDVVE